MDTSSQPVPIPPLSSRHLRLTLRVKSTIESFGFDFVLSNANTSGNSITCKAIGSGSATPHDDSLKILSGMHVDFGRVVDGLWARRMITLKNNGERVLEVKFSGTKGFEVGFRLGGVAGDDMDGEEEEIGMGRALMPVKSREVDGLSRSSTREGTGSGRGRDVSTSYKSSRGGSPSSSIGRNAGLLDGRVSPYLPPSGPEVFPLDLTHQLRDLEPDQGVEKPKDPSQPNSRSLSRITSRTSSYRYHTSGDSEDETEDQGEGDHDTPFFGITAESTHQTTHDRTPHLVDTSLETLPDQIEEISMRPGTEYRISVHYRPSRDTTSPPSIAGALRTSTFQIHLDTTLQPPRSTHPTQRRSINCTSESCTSLISLTSGPIIDFGKVTVGASKASVIVIENLSAVSAKVEIAAISKVLSANRSVVVIPPFESVEERLEFFPRRINERYEKQVFVRNLLNRVNGECLTHTTC